MGDDDGVKPGSIYSFGETDLAAERLRIVSEVFDPTSETFLCETVLKPPRLALDLGCGPGFSTRLLSRVTSPARIIGVDRSEAFLCRARAGTLTGEEYVAADVGGMPLRIAGVRAQPDLIYARFLASHLAEPEKTISGWGRELEPGGILIIEEVDSISTNVAAFDGYLKIVSEVLAQHGNELFVGSRLAAIQWDVDLRIQVNRSTDVRPVIRQAARMFSMNLPNWRRDPFVEATYPPEKLESLAVELDRLTAFADTGRIAWKMRQISLRLEGKSYH
ncbi:MAG: hypothetical protein C5B58_09845 [Acidobacteria bacterium]|nr:MAG: hypothetical protein C5B58_09845 [Acidobacteriota bacterium]